MKQIDFKTLVIGLLLGICVMLTISAVKNDPAQKADADYRYQISAASYVDSGQNVNALFILDHETNKVYSVRAPSIDNIVFDIKRDLKR